MLRQLNSWDIQITNYCIHYFLFVLTHERVILCFHYNSSKNFIIENLLIIRRELYLRKLKYSEYSSFFFRSTFKLIWVSSSCTRNKFFISLVQLVFRWLISNAFCAFAYLWNVIYSNSWKYSASFQWISVL